MDAAFPMPFAQNANDPLVLYNPYTGWMAWKPPSNGPFFPFSADQSPFSTSLRTRPLKTDPNETDVIHLGDVPGGQPNGTRKDSSCEMCLELGLVSHFPTETLRQLHAQKHAAQLGLGLGQTLRTCFPNYAAEEESPQATDENSTSPPSRRETEKGDPTLDSVPLEDFPLRTPARSVVTLTPDLQNLVRGVVHTITKDNSIRCKMSGCSFGLDYGVTNTLRAVSSHLLSHYPKQLFYCLLCKTPVSSSNHQGKHTKEKTSKIMIDAITENEQPLIELFHECFGEEISATTPKKPNKFERPSPIKTCKKLNLQTISNPNLSFDLSKGVAGRTTTNAFPRPITNLIHKMRKEMENSGVPIKCRFTSSCPGEWKANNNNAKKDIHTVFIAIATHIIRHYNKPLFYCTQCEVWEMKPEYHRSRAHKGEGIGEFMLDFMDCAVQELVQVFIACFPDQEKALGACFREEGTLLSLSTAPLSRTVEVSFPIPSFKKMPEPVGLKGTPISGFLTYKIRKLGDELIDKSVPGSIISCNECDFTYRVRENSSATLTRKLLRNSICAHVLSHLGKEVYFCTKCDNKGIRSPFQHVGKCHKEDKAADLIVSRVPENEQLLDATYERCFGFA